MFQPNFRKGTFIGLINSFYRQIRASGHKGGWAGQVIGCTPDSLHALAFANAGYRLWHANQAARYNILNGIMPPASGHWKNNPHADCDLRYQYEFSRIIYPLLHIKGSIWPSEYIILKPNRL
jgi:hypothetical protein